MRATWLFAALLSSAAACGGAPPDARSGAHHDRPGPGGGGGEPPAADGTSSAPTRAKTCDDGTCFTCGEGVCPVGFFCDERAAGGAACAWLPECAAKPSCDCLQTVLGSDCACRASGTGFSVECS